MVFVHTADPDDHLLDVKKALKDSKGKWRDIGENLGIKEGKLDEINLAKPGDPNGCLTGTITEWLKRNYDTKKFGEPSWRKLVEAVQDFDENLARKIAAQHPGR